MEPETEHTAPAFGPPTGFRSKERPGWMAIVLIAAFVLAGVVIYLVGVHLLKR